MNRQRMKELGKAFSMIGRAKIIIETVKEEEQKSYEDLPDNFRHGEHGKGMLGCVGMMAEAIEYLEDANSVIEQI